MKKMGWWLGMPSLLILLLILGNGQGCKAEANSRDTDEGPLPNLEITCNPDSFELICTTFKEDIYVLATLRIGKHEWKNVRLRLRGDTSREFPKKSLKLKIPKAKRLPFGRTTLNLNAEYLDKTYLRQYLCTRLFKDSGQPCYATQHLLVHVNGVFHGIFLLVEGIDDNFLEKWGMSKKGDLFKATRDGACLSHYDDVKALWERKTPKKDSSWDELESLIAQLDTIPDQAYAAWAHKTFAYKNMTNSIAMNMLIGNRSTYYHNYFMYCSPDKRQWRYLPWDMDNTFLLAEVDDYYQRGNNSDTRLGDMPSNPFFERALVTPAILQDIQLRIDNLSATIYNPAYLFPIIDSLARQLAPAIVGDTFFHKHTLDSWQFEITQLKDYISRRATNLKNQFEFNPRSFRLIQPTAALGANDMLRWHPASDPNDDPLTYEVCYSLEDRFTSATTSCFPAVSDTFFAVPRDLPAGRYFWKILVTDGTQQIRGFDNRATFEIVGK